MRGNYTIITARTFSKRLPKKILLKFEKKRTIDIIISRAKKIGIPIVLATTKNKEDDFLVNYVKKNYKINIFRGSEKNVLKRWQECFKKFNIKFACMVDADDLIFDFNLYRSALSLIRKKKFDLIVRPKNIVTGLFNYVISSKLINKSEEKYDKKNIQLVEPLFRRLKMKTFTIKTKYVKKRIRLTQDYFEDYLFFKMIFSKFKVDENSARILKFLVKNKDLNKINYFRETFWKRNQKKMSQST